MISRDNVYIEIARILSTFFIVWYHSEIDFGHEVSYSGLVVFILISLILGTGGGNASLRLDRRLNRLVWPWLFWMLFYGIGNLSLSRPFISIDDGYTFGILAGSYMHLWYLPFIFFVLIIYDFVKILVDKKIILLFSIFAFALIILYVEVWRMLALPKPIPQYLHALCPVFVGVILGEIQGYFNRYMQYLTAIVLLVFMSLAINYQGVGIPYIVGTMVVLIAFNPFMPNVCDPFRGLIYHMSRLTYGVYLLHPIFLYVFGRIASGYIIPFYAFIFSLISVHVIIRLFPKVSGRIM